jgi:hypothetical protein
LAVTPPAIDTANRAAEGHVFMETCMNTSEDDEVAPKTSACSSDERTPVSERKLLANRANALRSTGPKTATGKQHSSFNSLTHGLLAKKIMFNPEGNSVEEGLHQLLESLRTKYGRGDIRLELLFEEIIIDYWRHSRGLQSEINLFKQSTSAFHPEGIISNLHRYISGNRRSLFRNLQLLDTLPKNMEEEAEDSVP